MIYESEKVEKWAIMQTAELMVAAARTAPKGCGVDNLQAMILDGDDKKKLTSAMREIAAETGADFFNRDASNVDQASCIVMIGSYNRPIGLPGCSLCGFAGCSEMSKAGANCAFNITDLGIAIGSAVSIAADRRIDNRVLFSAGKAAVKIKCFDENVRVCYGIPLMTSSKNIFFDRGETFSASEA